MCRAEHSECRGGSLSIGALQLSTFTETHSCIYTAFKISNSWLQFWVKIHFHVPFTDARHLSERARS